MPKAFSLLLCALLCSVTWKVRMLVLYCVIVVTVVTCQHQQFNSKTSGVGQQMEIPAKKLKGFLRANAMKTINIFKFQCESLACAFNTS